MRGFRASRAAINFKSAHWGKQPGFKVINGGQHGPDQQQDQKKELPDWLKMPAEPEVKKAEKKQHLRLVEPAPVEKKAPVKKAVKVKASASASPKKAATVKAKVAGAKAVVKKRKTG